MNSAKKESIAITALINEINKYDNLQEDLQKRDKIPVWDGKIEIYKSDSSKTTEIIGEIPVQVKGTDSKKQQGNTYYDVKISDIQTYQKTNRGTIYFVIEIDKDRNTKIYYKIFDLKTIEQILETTKNQKTKRLKFTPLKNNELITICIEFINQQKIYKQIKKISEIEVYEKKAICYNYNAKYELDEIKKSNEVFYETNAYKEAKEKLEKQNIIILHGEPWVGKTSTARRLVSDYTKQGYLFVYGNVDDLPQIKEQVAVGEKIICLLDDFLGSNVQYLEKNVAESTLDKIVSIFKNSKEKKLIFTTRTYIYNNAKDLFYKFHNATKIKNEYLIDVSNYTYEEKGNILYNHMKKNNLLGTKTHQKLVDDEFYAEVIASDNFNPGIISLLCERLKENEIKDVKGYITKALKDPDQLWEEEYKKLSSYEKIILTIIVLFGVKVPEIFVKEQFYQIIEDENIKLLDSEIFSKAVHTLSNAFVKITFNEYNEKEFEVCRHSVADYIINKIKYREINIERYIKSAKYAEELRYINIINVNDKVNEQIAKKAEDDIDNIKGFIYDEKQILFNIMRERLNDKRIKLLCEIIDEEFELQKPNIIINILEYETNEFYTYTKERFKEYVTQGEYIDMLFDIDSILDCEIFFKTIAEVSKYQKDSDFIMCYFCDIEDALVEIIQEDVEATMSDMTEYIARDIIEGKDLQTETNEFIEAAFYDEIPSLRNIFSKKYIDILLQYLYDNCYIYIDEDVIEDEIENLESKPENDIKPALYKYKTDDIEQINIIKEKFEKGMIVESKKEINLSYFDIRTRIKNHGKWCISSFIWENNESEYNNIKLYEEFIRNKKQQDESVTVVAKEFLNYLLFEKNKISSKANDLLNEIAYDSFKNNTYIIKEKDIKKYEKKFSKELKELYNTGAILKYEHDTKLINTYIHLYIAVKELIKRKDNLIFIMKKWNDVECYEWESKQIQNDLQYVFQLYSEIETKEFNKWYIIPELKAFINDINIQYSKLGKMNVSRAILNLIRLEINLNKAFEEECAIGYTYSYMDFIEFVTGINIEAELSSFDYGIYQKELYEKCFDEEENEYKINFLQVIKDKNLRQIFDKLKVWDFLYSIYIECEKILEILENNDELKPYEIGKQNIKNKIN